MYFWVLSIGLISRQSWNGKTSIMPFFFIESELGLEILKLKHYKKQFVGLFNAICWAI